MKRKIFVLIAAFMLLFGVTGQAMAYFEDSHLFRVVYDRGGNFEVVTDLGSGFDKTAAYTGNKLFNTNNFSLSQLGISTWDNVYVAYFMRDALEGAHQAWTSGPTTGSQTTYRKWSAYVNQYGNLQAYNQNKEGAGVQNVNAQDLPNQSYNMTMGEVGKFGGFLEQGTGDALLSSFNQSGSQFVDQRIYYFADPQLLTRQTGVPVYTIRTYEGGTTEINPVPVPAAVYLLGTGLLGLVGIRRKMASA